MRDWHWSLDLRGWVKSLSGRQWLETGKQDEQAISTLPHLSPSLLLGRIHGYGLKVKNSKRINQNLDFAKEKINLEWTNLGNLLCWALPEKGCWTQKTSRGPFQPQHFCDSVNILCYPYLENKLILGSVNPSGLVHYENVALSVNAFQSLWGKTTPTLILKNQMTQLLSLGYIPWHCPPQLGWTSLQGGLHKPHHH